MTLTLEVGHRITRSAHRLIKMHKYVKKFENRTRHPEDTERTDRRVDRRTDGQTKAIPRIPLPLRSCCFVVNRGEECVQVLPVSYSRLNHSAITVQLASNNYTSDLDIRNSSNLELVFSLTTVKRWFPGVISTFLVKYYSIITRVHPLSNSIFLSFKLSNSEAFLKLNKRVLYFYYCHLQFCDDFFFFFISLFLCFPFVYYSDLCILYA